MTARRLTAQARALAANVRGLAAVEFAMIAPVMFLLLIGALDIGHTLYMQAVLQGVVQKIGRDNTLENNADPAQQAILDAKVGQQVRWLIGNAKIEYKRRFYRTFTDAAAAQGEEWTDTNDNGVCDAGEPYVDANNNNVWDKDGGDQGQGGAKDKTVYTVIVRYPRLLPLDRMLPKLSSSQMLVAQTVLANQPYTDQGSYTVTNTVRNCP